MSALSVEDRLARLEAALGIARADPRGAGELVPRRAAVLRAAAEHWLCSVDEITALARPAWLIPPRAAVVWALRQQPTPLSFDRIGQLLGGRDHSTCVNLHVRALSWRANDVLFAAACDRLAKIATSSTLFVESIAA